jgi:hypothetical protein
MVVANVIGDLIAVFVFKSLAAIAVASILFTMLGVWLGYIFLDKELHLDHRSIFTAGIEFYKSIYIKFRNSGLLPAK